MTVLIAVMAGLGAFALGWRPREGFWLSISLGGLLTLFGVTFPRTSQNGLFGVRTPWTLENPEVWRITHEFAGKVYLVAGALCITAGLLIDPGWAALGSVLVVIFSSLLPMDYSRVIAKRLKARQTASENADPAEKPAR